MGYTLQLPDVSDVTIWEHQLFNGLSQSQRLWLSERMEHLTLPAKSPLFQPSDLANQLYYLLKGHIKVEIISGGKNWMIRDIFSPDEFLGLNGLFGQSVRREYARSLRSKAQLVVFQNADLRRLMEVNFDFAEKILELAAQQILHLEKRTVELTEHTANTRFVSFLLERLEKESSFDGRDWFYDSQITQEEIGAYIGTGRQTVTEILTDLKSKNILTYNWGKFWVHDLEALKKVNG